MSDSKKEGENVVRLLEESLKKMPKNLRFFSLGMRSLYSNRNPGTSTEISRKFIKLRDDARKYAKIYSKVILPLTTDLVSSIENFIKYYDAPSYEKWCDLLPDILENVKANKDFAETLLSMYEEVIVPLKKREEEARVIMTEFKDLQTEYENATNEFKANTKTEHSWALALQFIPEINAIATLILRSYANEDSAKATAEIKESEIHEAAALVVAETLIPSLVNFIEGLKETAKLFQTMEINLFKKDSKASHYKAMKDKVKEIYQSCHAFNTALLASRTDVETIPDGDTQQNYVKKWLEKKLKEIEDKTESTRKHFWNVVKKMPEISLESIIWHPHNLDQLT